MEIFNHHFICNAKISQVSVSFIIHSYLTKSLCTLFCLEFFEKWMDIAAHFKKIMAKSVKKHHVSTSESSPPATFILNNISFEMDGSIQYKEKSYFSASEALDAYIDDFRLNCELTDINDAKVNPDENPLKFLAKLNSGKLSFFSEFFFF